MEPLHTIIKETQLKHNQNVNKIKKDFTDSIIPILNGEDPTIFRIEYTKEKERNNVELEDKFKAYNHDKKTNFNKVDEIPDFVKNNLVEYLKTDNSKFLKRAHNFVDTSELDKRSGMFLDEYFYVNNDLNPKPDNLNLYTLFGGLLGFVGVVAANTMFVSPEETSLVVGLGSAIAGGGIGSYVRNRIAETRSNIYKSIVEKANETAEFINERPNLKKIIEDYKK